MTRTKYYYLQINLTRLEKNLFQLYAFHDVPKISNYHKIKDKNVFVNNLMVQSLINNVFVLFKPSLEAFDTHDGYHRIS